MTLFNKLIKNNIEDYLYCTACLDIDKSIDFDIAYQKFQELASLTIKEEGCIDFFVIPKRLTHQFILWEIWKNEKAFHYHHKAPHTLKVANEKITSVKWFDSSIPIEF